MFWDSDLKYRRRSINICCKKEMRERRKELKEGRKVGVRAGPG